MSQRIREALRNPEVSEKHSQSISGEKNHRFGKKHSPETLEKISKSLKGRKRSPEIIERMCVTARENNPMSGRKHLEESKQKMREAHARRRSA